MSRSFKRTIGGGRSGAIRKWLAQLGFISPKVGPAVVVGLGLGHLFVAGWNFNREIQEFSAELGPIVAVGLVGFVSLLVTGIGYWLWNSQYTASQRGVVALGTVVGSLIFGTILYISILVRLTEGRAISEPVFVLSLASSQGAFAGSLVSVLYVRVLNEAESARRRRDQIEFVSGILRHDVLNSMTVIRSRAEMIERGETDRQAEFAEVIVGRSEKVIDLSERVKNVVSVMASDEAMERHPVALASLVESQVEAIQPQSDGVTIETDIHDVEVLADELLAEVVGNLVENALSHGLGDDGTISVTTTLDDQRVQLRVADTGEGVPDERKEEIFDRGASSGGGGFGLFFVETMVDHYEGDIWVEDRTDGRSGAVFVVELDVA